MEPFLAEEETKNDSKDKSLTLATIINNKKNQKKSP